MWPVISQVVLELTNELIKLYEGSHKTKQNKNARLANSLTPSTAFIPISACPGHCDLFSPVQPREEALDRWSGAQERKRKRRVRAERQTRADTSE